MTLKEELLKQKAEIEAKLEKLDNSSQPKPLANIDWSAVQEQCEQYINTLANEGYVDEDVDNYIYEAAMQAVFGENVWKWINAVTQ